MNALPAIFLVLGAVVLLVVLAFLLIPSLRGRDSGRLPSAKEAAREAVSEIVVEEKEAALPISASAAAIADAEDHMAEKAASLGIELTPAELYFAAIQEIVFDRRENGD